MGLRGSKARLFVEQIDFSGECWIWTGTKFHNGYGRTGDGVGAHRRSYERFVGPIPKGQLVMHRCDVKPCVRPSHLELGTPADNMADMVLKGRSLRGPANHQAKLTPSKVVEIRYALEDGWTKAELARRYAVSEALIFAIAKRTAWAWV